LLDFIEQVVFDHYKVTVIGSVPVTAGSGASSIPFRIKGEINRAAVRRGLLRLMIEYASLDSCLLPGQAVELAISTSVGSTLVRHAVNIAPRRRGPE
jgi:hypothetical protein